MHEKIKVILANIIGAPEKAGTISNDADIFLDIGLDSLQAIKFLLQVEEECVINIDYDKLDFNHFSSIDRFCQYLGELKSVDITEY